MRSVLEAVFGGVDGAFAALPFALARPLTVGFLLLAAAAPLFLPRSLGFGDSPDTSRHRDLRIWAAVAMVPYVLIYALV